MNLSGPGPGLPENKMVCPRPETMGKCLGWARNGRCQRTLCIPPSSLFFHCRRSQQEMAASGFPKSTLPLSGGGRPPGSPRGEAWRFPQAKPAASTRLWGGMTRGQTFSGVSALRGGRTGPRARRGAGAGGRCRLPGGQRAAALFSVPETKHCRPVLLSIHGESTFYSNKHFSPRGNKALRERGNVFSFLGVNGR